MIINPRLKKTLQIIASILGLLFVLAGLAFIEVLREGSDVRSKTIAEAKLRRSTIPSIQKYGVKVFKDTPLSLEQGMFAYYSALCLNNTIESKKHVEYAIQLEKEGPLGSNTSPLLSLVFYLIGGKGLDADFEVFKRKIEDSNYGKNWPKEKIKKFKKRNCPEKL